MYCMCVSEYSLVPASMELEADSRMPSLHCSGPYSLRQSLTEPEACQFS